MTRFPGALLLAVGLCSVQGARAEKLTIMVGGIEKQIYLPAKLADQLGYLKEQGLEVELLTEPAGVQAENAMLAGEVQAVVGFYDHSIDLQSKGKFVESIVQFSQAPGEVELVSTKYPQVKRMADLRGKSLGVTGLGSSTNFLTQFLMVKDGVPLGEFNSLPVGAGTTFALISLVRSRPPSSARFPSGNRSCSATWLNMTVRPNGAHRAAMSRP